jgi:hypothetical protein
VTDLAATIAPKSDQINADDLIAGPLTIAITRVTGCDNPDQPIAIHFEGDGGKPFKPCKSMRRVLVHCWGADGNTFAGRRMTLYRDDKVQFGGIQVGGIRISHLSHIERDVTMALTATRAKRNPYTVKPLRADVKPAQRPQETAQAAGFDDEPAFDVADWLASMTRAVAGMATVEDLNAAWQRASAEGHLKWLKRDDLADLTAAFKARKAELTA